MESGLLAKFVRKKYVRTKGLEKFRSEVLCN